MRYKDERSALLALLPDTERQIYLLLQKPRRVSELGKEVGMTTGTASIYLGRLKDKGLVRRLDRGIYIGSFAKR